MTAINSSSAPIVSELGFSNPLNSVEQVPENLTFSVATVSIQRADGASKWIPKGPTSAFPATHTSLPFSLAVEAVRFLNGIESRHRKGRLSFVTRKPSNSKGRWDVLTVQGSFDSLQNRHVLNGYCLTGATLEDALLEALRINTEIVRYSQVPKVWAVLIVEGVGEGVQS